MKLKGAKGLFLRNCKKMYIYIYMCFNAIYCSVGSFRWEASQGLWQSLILSLILINRPFILGFYCLPIKCNLKLGARAWLFTGGFFFSFAKDVKIAFTEKKKISEFTIDIWIKEWNKINEDFIYLSKWNLSRQGLHCKLDSVYEKNPWFCFRFLFPFHGTWYSW